MALRGIDTDAEDFRLSPYSFPRITKAARLRGATRRIVFRIKIKNHRRAAKIAQRNFLTVAIFAAYCERVE